MMSVEFLKTFLDCHCEKSSTKQSQILRTHHTVFAIATLRRTAPRNENYKKKQQNFHSTAFKNTKLFFKRINLP
ncbi:MAG: hypothetical protein V4642_01790 [Bacteroidota bacterium]